MKCFCENEMVEIKINNATFLSCDSCGFLRKKTLPNRVEEKERYDHHICDDGYLKYMNSVYAKIKEYIHGNALDFGCGQIHALSDIMNENGNSCDYYDLYYYPQIPKEKYDTIILIEVFEHVADIYSLMKELHGRLLNSGRVIIMTQKKKYPLEKWWYIRDITHVSFVDSKTMQILAKMSGFTVMEVNDFYVFEKVEA